MLFNIDEIQVKTVWHKQMFDACKSRLSDEEYRLMVTELNHIIQTKIDNNEKIAVSTFIPGSNWAGTVWNPIYTKSCGHDEEQSALFFGLLVCQIMIDRDEKWYFIKQENVAKGMIYFMSNKAS